MIVRYGDLSMAAQKRRRRSMLADWLAADPEQTADDLRRRWNEWAGAHHHQTVVLSTVRADLKALEQA